MDLAAAIRRAALNSGAPLGQPEAGSSASNALSLPQPEAANLAEEKLQMKEHEAQEVHHNHNIVRLELVLNPEQLKSFFGAVIATQHSVLTLRGAAGFLRVSQTSLQRMAEEGDVPGMMVDGKWRFTRQALDDWLSANPQKKEA